MEGSLQTEVCGEMSGRIGNVKCYFEEYLGTDNRIKLYQEVGVWPSLAQLKTAVGIPRSYIKVPGFNLLNPELLNPASC